MPDTQQRSDSQLRNLIRTEIAGHDVQQLAAEFGTPVYVYDAATIAQRIADLAQFDVVRYAQKACSNLAIIDLVRRNGALVDSVSAGEIRRALAAGYSPQGEPPPIVYTADIFDRASLDLVVQHDVHVNCGSIDMIEQLGERAPGRNITLRINPGFGHGHSQKTNTGGESSKHGIWHERLGLACGRAEYRGLSVTGVHVHIGSGTDMEHLAQVCGAVEKFATEVGRSVTSISAGGGLPIRYTEDDSSIDIAAYYALWDQTRNRLQDAFGHDVRLEIEPGRYISAESGYLVTEVRAVKQIGDRTFYLVDAGFNNLARPVMYGAYHPISMAPVGDPASRPLQEAVVGGPLCESGDIFTQREGGYVCTRTLPAAQVGDMLVIECAGAYGFAMSSNYNSKPLAAEVLLSDGHPHLIRRRQTFDDIIRGEQIPAHAAGGGK
ncbi:MAG: diaminopimelate decarboxylase [Planctomycetales bacterium]|nr:diaminopimelate decarboxylase [Planctomycetales bacterium]